MKKLLLASGALWIAAMAFGPAPASAFLAKYPSYSPNYFACSGYQTSAPAPCTYNYGGETFSVTFNGFMTNTIPLSACSGNCGGTEDLGVRGDPGNGRKTKLEYLGQCGNGYVLNLSPCTNCT